MNCPKCGEVCRCSTEPPLPDSPSSEQAAPGNAALSKPEGAENESGENAWRDELSARLSRYRRRRKAPPPRYPSLRLPFETIGSRPLPGGRPQAAPLFGASDQALALDGIAHPDPSASEVPSIPRQPDIRIPEAAAAAPLPHPTAKIIEFPRFAWAPPPPPLDQLAEPVIDRPRILDVPDVVPPPPALGGITIEPPPAEEYEKRPGIDVPLQTATIERRLAAGLIDGLLITAAVASFGFIFWKMTAFRPPNVQILGFGAGVLFSCWTAYHYLLVVYGASTPGLTLARLQLAKFDGSQTSRSQRRWRVLASCLSALSLGMGFAWVLLDEDGLCWHDRITRTYLAPRARSTKPD